MEKTLKIDNFKERFNYFYGIDDFYTYLKNDNLINDKDKIKSLIKNIEKYLSEKLDHYDFYLSRENNVTQLINSFQI